MKKNLLTIITVLSLSGGTVMAGQGQGDINLSAKINPGCALQVSDISFGNINQFQKTPFNKESIQSSIRCSNGINLNITVLSEHNPSGQRGAFMKHTLSNQLLQYKIETMDVTSNEFYTVTRLPRQNWLANFTSEYSLDIKVVSKNQFTIPFKAQILNNYSEALLQSGYHYENYNNMSNMPAGDYHDNLTFILTF